VKPSPFVSTIEEDEDEVPRPRYGVEKADRRLLAEPEVLLHALAGVEEHAEVQGELLAVGGIRGRREQLELLHVTVFFHREVVGGEIADEPTPLVAGGHRHLDDVEPDPEHGCLLRARRSGEQRQDEKRQQRARHRREAPLPV
jgi:hypothetical protein